MDFSLLIFGALSVTAGFLAASNFVIERLPNAKDLLVKILPYQAIIGLVSMIFSVLKFLELFNSKDSFFTSFLVLICCCSTAIVGFLLGFPMVQQWITSDENSKKKADQFRKKLLPYQVLAGLISLIVGVLLMLQGLIS
jgi:hypothetical protein